MDLRTNTGVFMKKLSLIGWWLCMMLVATSAFGQITISGKVTEGDGVPLFFANVMHLHDKDSTILNAVTSDESGYFEIKADTYTGWLKVIYLGYEDQVIPLRPNQQHYSITMTDESLQLDEVVVKARKMLYEQKSDRLIVNVDAVPSMKGDNALQILQKSPSIIVQENNNSIAIGGKGEAMIMINNRVMRVPRNVIIQQLQSMAADNIERVEIIHQPGARYEANNNAGIIHIVLKENPFSGFNGNASVMLGYGQREKANSSLNLNFRRQKISIYGSFNAFQNRSPFTDINHFREYGYQGDEYFFENRLRFANPINRSFNMNTGIDYEINEETTVGLMFGYMTAINNGDDFTSDSEFKVNGNLSGNSSYLIDMENPTSNNFFNINFFRKLGAHSTLNLDADRMSLSTTNVSRLQDQQVSEAAQLEAKRRSEFDIYTFKADFEYYSPDDIRLQFGTKGAFNESTTNSSVLEQHSGQSDLVDFFTRGDQLTENLWALYGSMLKPWGDHWESEVGLRYEYYQYLLQGLDDDDLDISFRNLFPVVRVNYQLDSVQNLSIAFNRRTTRATFWQIAGYYALLDPSLFVTSNTQIRPSFTNAIRLSYQYRSVIFALEANRTNGPIAYYNYVDKERHLQTSIPTNFDRMDVALLNISFPLRLHRVWETNWNLMGSYNRIKDSQNRPIPFERELFSAMIQLNNSFELGKDWTASIDGRYMTPYLSGDQEQFLRHYVNIGIQKSFANGSTLTFSVQDLTRTSGIIDWEYNQPALDVRTFGSNDWSERVFRLTYNFSFGNSSIRSKRNRKTSSQEERDRIQ